MDNNNENSSSPKLKQWDYNKQDGDTSPTKSGYINDNFSRGKWKYCNCKKQVQNSNPSIPVYNKYVRPGLSAK